MKMNEKERNIAKAAAIAVVAEEVESIVDEMVSLFEFASMVGIKPEEVSKVLDASMGMKKEDGQEKEPEMEEEEIKEPVDIDQDEVIRKVADEIGLPVCLVDRVITIMFKTLLDMGCNGMKFGEVKADEE